MSAEGSSTSRVIRVDGLTRVEGEGGLLVELDGDGAAHVELRIFEAPRFFEAFLVGRAREEVPDITARICGICPVAYQMSSCQALEQAAGLFVEGPLRELRRLLYCGEWIESHALHVFMLHAPDFLGYPDAIAMAKDHPELVKAALQIKKAGNAIVARLGGREIHPINVKLGGFYRAPERAELTALVPALDVARALLIDLLPVLAAIEVPQVERQYQLVALRHPTEYAVLDGRLASSTGLDVDVRDTLEHVVEAQVPYSMALQAHLAGHGEYVVGPLARFNLSFERLCDSARAAADALQIAPPLHNPFKSLHVRVVEILEALAQASEIISRYQRPERAAVPLPMRSGVGHGATEAPRGVLYHRYHVDDRGAILDARIIPPTSQNQRAMEGDLRALADRLVTLPHAEATHLAERAIRNYDPCISCATHFLKLNIVGGTDKAAT